MSGPANPPPSASPPPPPPGGQGANASARPPRDPGAFVAWQKARRGSLPAPADLVREWISVDQSRSSQTLADVLIADADARASQGLEPRFETYAREIPELLSDEEACRALLMHELARLEPGAISPAVKRIAGAIPGVAQVAQEVAELCGVMASAERLPPASEPISGDMLGKYTLIERLGVGSFGTVWRADDRELAREVALKLLHPSVGGSLDRVMAEAKAAAAISHPSIVAVHAAGVFADGQAYIDTQLVGDPSTPGGRILVGKPLDRDTKKRTPRQCAEIIRAVTRGVALAHARGVVHRDIKPANIIVAPSGTPLLADFGLSALGGTTSGRVSGTPAFMPPEQARGEPATPASDIYALGATLRYLLTGEPPIAPSQGSSDAREDVLSRVRAGEISGLEATATGLPLTLRRICDKAMAPNTADRYASAGHLADDLDAWLDHHPTAAGREDLATRLALWFRRHAAAATVGIAAIATLAVVSERSIREILHQRNQAIIARDEADDHRKRAEEAAEIAHDVNFFMQEALITAQADAGGKSVTMYDAIVAASERLDATVPQGGLADASIRHVMGRVFSTMGDFVRAEANLRRSLEIREKMLNRDHPDLLYTRFALAEMLSLAGRVDEAAAIIEPLDKQCEELLGKTHDLRLNCRDVLIQVRIQQHRLTSARELIRLNIDARKAVAKPDEIKLANGERQLGTLAKESGQKEIAVEYFEKALERATRVLGENAMETTSLRNDLGSVLAEMGNVERAEPLLRKAFASLTARLSPQHVNRIDCGYNLAWMLLNKKKAAAEAYAIIEPLVPAAEASMGTQSVTHTRCLLLKGRSLYGMERFTEAEPVLRDTASLAEHLGRDGVALDAVASRTLGACLIKLGKAEEAKAWQDRGEKKRLEALKQ